MDRVLGVAQPPGFPFNLNSAVDHLLKKEFDIHRAKKSAHPLMEVYGVDAVPFEHQMMDKWRENFHGVEYLFEPANFLVFGAVDDIWVNPKGEIIVVDYKATAKDAEVTLDAEWQIAYKRQMEFYQWLLRMNGFRVSDTGYFVYANGDRSAPAFDGKLEFKVKLIPYVGNDSWVEDALIGAKNCLELEKIPKYTKSCEFCQYQEKLLKI